MNLVDRGPTALGREHEFQILAQALRDTHEGRGQVVLVSGTAGIGKTTLLEVFAGESTSRGSLVLVGRSHDQVQTPPYGPWRDLFPQAEGPPLAFANDDRGPDTATVANEIFSRLASLTSRQPVLLVFEDAHWSDPASLDVVRILARKAGSLPLLFVITYRDDLLADCHHLRQLLPAIARESHPVRISLRPLLPATVAQIVLARYDLTSDDARRLTAYLDSHALGNPRFIRELLHALEDAGRVRRTGAGTAVGDLSEVAISPILRQIVAEQINQLPADAQRLLQIAATIGEAVPLDLWLRVATVDEGSLLEVVEAAVSASLLVELADGSGVRFTHSLIREVLYRGSLALRRRSWHRSVAETLLAEPDPVADLVAHHFREAGDERATEWLIRAGDLAVQSDDVPVATRRFEDALALLAESGSHHELRCELLLRLGRLHRRNDRGVAFLDQATQIAAQSRDATLLAATLFRLGFVQCYTGHRRQGLLSQERGVAALDALPASEAARLERLDWASATVAARHGSHALRLAEVGRFAEAASHADLALADASANPWTSHDARVAQAVIARSMGRPDDALRLDAEMYAIDRRIDDHDGAVWLAANDLFWSCFSYWPENRAWLEHLEHEIVRREPGAGEVFATLPLRLMHLPMLYLRGEWQTAREVVRAARQTEFATHAFTQVIPLVLGPLAVAQGDLDLAWRLVRDEFPDGPSTEPGDNRFPTSIALQRVAAASAINDGDLRQARLWLDANERWLAWSGAVLGLAEHDLLRARYEQTIGDLDAARARGRSALERAQQPRQPLVLLATHRLLAELDIATGQFDAAAGQIEHALRLADSIAMPYERALTLLTLAELHLSSGAPADAAPGLEEASAILTTLNAQPALTLARELTSRGGDQPRHPTGLTLREIEVLRTRRRRTQ